MARKSKPTGLIGAVRLKLFIASPNDVAPERNFIRKQIRKIEIDEFRQRSTPILIDPVMWEHDATTEVSGTTPQNIINKQLMENYQGMIAIFWSRIGTSVSNKYISSTVEEIADALLKSKTDESFKLMVYFKTKQIKIDLPTADLQQLQGLQNFYKIMRDKGGLIGTFQNKKELNQLLRRDIIQWAGDYRTEEEDDDELEF